MTETQWSDPIIADDHQLLHVSRIFTGQTVELPHDGALIRCRIYHLDTGATIAIGQHDGLTIIYQAEG